MKIPVITCTVFSLVLIFGNCSYRDHDIKISVSESDAFFRFEASYPTEKTGAVRRFINEAIKPNNLFHSEEDVFDVTTTLGDGTLFKITSSQGKVKIDLDRKRNSPASYQRIKRMGEGLKEVLK